MKRYKVTCDLDVVLNCADDVTPAQAFDALRIRLSVEPGYRVAITHVEYDNQYVYDENGDKVY